MSIELRKWNPDDIRHISNLCNNVERTYLRNRLPYPYTKKDAKWWLKMVAANDGTAGVYRAVIIDDIYIGNISVEKRDDVYEKSAEIGYMLLKEYYSKGLMTEAVKLMCELAFTQLDIVRITGEVYEPNIASRRVLEHNGFICEGKLRKAVYKDGNYYDELIYGLLKDEWRNTDA